MSHIAETKLELINAGNELVGYIDSSKLLFAKDKEILGSLEEINEYILGISHPEDLKVMTQEELIKFGGRLRDINSMIIHELEKDLLPYSGKPKSKS